MSTEQDIPKPPFPPMLGLGIALYLASYPLGVVAWFVANPELTDDQESLLFGLSCIAMPLIAVEIGSLIMACFGRAWAAWVFAGVIGLGLVASIPVYDMYPFGLFDALYFSAAIGSAVCLFAPSALKYYRWSNAYRRERAEHSRTQASEVG
jgi:hypothetical protein